MLTYAHVAPPVRDDRPGYRPFVVRVRRITRISPHFTRVTFTGDDVHFFGRDLLDQRIKIVLPLAGLGCERHPDSGFADFGQYEPESGSDWYSRLRELPAHQQNPFRTYTIRAVRPDDAEIDIDFVDHGAIGPAGHWLQTAVVGDQIVIVGPESRSIHSAGGIDWHPGPASRVLLAGDETAAPAICSILESLPEHVTATAFIEVPTSADALDMARNSHCATWIGRDDAPHGQRLEAAVREFVAGDRDYVLPALREIPEQLAEIDVDVEMLWDAPLHPGGTFYAWLAGEAATIKSMRRFLVSEIGVDRKQVAFMGYWRRGKAEGA